MAPHFKKIQKLREELKVVGEKMNKKTLICILGPVNTWFKTQDEFAEWDWIDSNFKKGRIYYHIKFLFQTLGSVVFPPLGLFFLLRSALSKNHLRELGNEYQINNEIAGEDWWFINGMSVNSNMIKTNGRQLAKMFHKKIHLFYNPTQGLLFDFFECLSGLVGHMNLITRRFAITLMRHFKTCGKKKLIIIAHSQGCIITAAAIRYIHNKGELEGLSSLEVYTFGSPHIDWVTYNDPKTLQRVPYYEHYANEHDYVAQIGILRKTKAGGFVPNNSDSGVLTPGEIYTADVWGHFFGEHYMSSLARHKYVSESSKEARLYKYLDKQDCIYPSCDQVLDNN